MTTPSPIASTQSSGQDPAREPSSRDESRLGRSTQAQARPENQDLCSVDPLRTTDRYRLTRPLLETPFRRSES